MAEKVDDATDKFVDEYFRCYVDEELRKDCRERADKIGRRDRIVSEAGVPDYAHVLWIDARRNYVLGNDVATIILCAAALEAGLRVYLGEYFQRKLSLDLSQAIDEMDIRVLIELCKILNVADETTISNIRKIGDHRHRFIHSKITSISKKIEKELVQRGEITTKEWQDDSILREFAVAALAGQTEAYEVLELLEKVYKGLYESFLIWKQ